VGCAMVIFESFMSSRAFKKGLEMNLLDDIARVAVVMLAVLLTMKIADLSSRHAFPLLFIPRGETYLYWLEIVVGIIAPLLLLSRARVRQNRNGLFAGGVMIILGFLLNRINISVTGMEAWAGVSYFPSWMELSVTAMIVTIGFIVFAWAAKNLPLFHHAGQDEETSGARIPDRAAVTHDINEDLRLISQSKLAKSIGGYHEVYFR
jgi:Ni/Fe-hydrogenase subunit HybB-like protein